MHGGSGGSSIAPGAQLEFEAVCAVPASVPTRGVLGLSTLRAAPSQPDSVLVGYDFAQATAGNLTGFATVPPELGHALDGPTIELRVFVDGNLVETFFHGGEAFLFTSTRNNVPSANVSSAFVNTAGLDCNVSSWVLGL